MNGLVRTVLISYVVLTSASCKKAKVDVDFNMDVANVYFIIDTTTNTGNVLFSSAQFNSELQKKLEDHDANADDVKSINITGGQFTMLNPGSQNFDIVERAYAYLSTATLAETRILYNENIPDDVTAVTMNADAADLKEYLKQPVVNFRADGFLSGPNTVRDTIQATLNFRIHAEVKP